MIKGSQVTISPYSIRVIHPSMYETEDSTAASISIPQNDNYDGDISPSVKFKSSCAQE